MAAQVRRAESQYVENVVQNLFQVLQTPATMPPPCEIFTIFFLKTFSHWAWK